MRARPDSKLIGVYIGVSNYRLLTLPCKCLGNLAAVSVPSHRKGNGLGRNRKRHKPQKNREPFNDLVAFGRFTAGGPNTPRLRITPI